MFAFAPAVSAQEVGDTFGFDSEASNNVAIEQLETDGSWSITTTGDDPFAVSTPLAQDLAEGELTLTFEYKASSSGKLELFFSTGANTQYPESMKMDFGTAPAAEEWTRVNVDISTAVQDWGWGKAGTTLRVDFGTTAGLRYNLRDIRITSDVADMFNGLEVKDGAVQINTQEDFDNWVAGLNGAYLGGSMLANVDVELNTDVKAVSTDGYLFYSYNGVFNGNYHVIDLDIQALGTTKSANFMGYLNGTMKNLYFTGKLESDQKFMGTVARDINASGYLENIHSSVNLLSSIEGDGTHGGVAGRTVGATVKNIVYAGKISSPVVSEEDGTYLTTWCGGVIGWAQPGSKFENVIMVGDISEISGEYVNAIVRDPSNNATNYEVKNVFAVNQTATMHPDVYAISAEELASGLACFMMNGDQENITWWQNIGTDAMPTFDNRDGSHKQVYAVGALNCDGSPAGEVTFNNEGGDEIPEHSFVDGTCEVCGADQPGFVELVDGWYVITTPEQFCYITALASKNSSTNIKLAADLDMSGYDYTPISGGYAGTLDGQGHTISNLIINNPDTRGQALISQAGPCTVKNLTLDNTCSITGGGYSAGFVAESTAAGTLTLENLFMHGTVVSNGANGAAIYSCNMGNVATAIIIKNCGMSGTVQTDREGGQISGWTGALATITGTWAIAEAHETRAGDNVQFVAPTGNTISNCYSIQGFGGGVTLIPVDAGETGQLTWLLNGQSFVNPTWYQNLDEGDAYPSLDPSRGVVYPTVDGYATVFPDDADSFENFKMSFSEVAAAYLESEEVELYAQPTLVEEYAEIITGYEDASTMADFEAVYTAEQAKKAEIQASIAAYKNYDAEIQNVIAELAAQEGLEGPDFDNLMDYLEGGLEPGATQVVPNGGYEYIMENRTLTPEQLETEVAWVKELLRLAIAGGYEVGAEITNLLTNATFADGFNGWEGTHFTNIQKSLREDNNLYGVEGFGSKKLHMYQTIAVTKSGVYELKVGGAWRPFNTWDPTSFDYYPYIYINGNATYLPAAAEEYVPVEEAVDGVNCNLTLPYTDLQVKDAEGNHIGYVMQSPQGICDALKSGRYDNRILVNLTEGDSLTIGINQPLSDYKVGANEWVGIGDIHLWYHGELTEAEEAVDRVLAGMLKRANNLINIQPRFDEDYVKFPNWSQTLKDRVAASIAKAEGAADVATKYEAIEELSAEFKEIIDNKKAYRSFFAQAERAYSSVYAASSIDPTYTADIIAQAEAVNIEAMDAYQNGSMTTEEAAACTVIQPLNAIPTTDENGTYHVANTAQYYYFADMANANTTDSNGKIYNVVLDGDVYVNTEMMISNFYGTFDGQDHTMNINIVKEADDAAPFAALRNGATVKNLIVRGDVSTTAKFAAAVAAHSYGGSNMDRIQSYVNIIGENEGGDGTHGGILAVNNDGVGIVRNSLFAGSLSGNSNCNGGIIGWSGYDARAINCLVIANITADPTSSNIIGRNYTTAQNCFYVTPYGGAPTGATQITEEDLLSGMVAYGLNGGSTRADVAWRQDLGNDIMPTLDPTHKVVYMTADSVYTNEPQHEIEKHLGTAEDPFLIATTADMAILRKFLVPGRVNYVKLTADIDMAEITNWYPLNMYEDEANGHQYQNFINFDGQGHVISNFTDNDFTDSYNSFFGILNGDVYNVGFENVDVSCTQSGTGVLAGYMGHDQYTNAEGVKLTSTLTNVWVTGKLQVASSYAGGLIGNIGGPTVMKNVYTNLEITGNAEFMGGLVGRIRDGLTIENAYAAGSVSKGGGIVGGGQKEETAAANYKNIVVWNNSDQNFGNLAANDQTEGISYFTGNNFAELQGVVVAWGKPWKCDMAEGSYPVFDGTTDTGINGVTIDTKGKIFNINGIQVEKTTKGIYIIDGKKVMVK